MKTLKPIRLKESYFENIEKAINKFFLDNVFLPINNDLKRFLNEKINAINPLVEAILKNKVQLIDNKLEGSFNSTLVKEIKKLGGRYNKITNQWAIPTDNLTPDLIMASVSSKRAIEKISNKIISMLDNLDIEQKINDLDLTGLYTQNFMQVNEEIELTAKDIMVMPKLSKDAIEVMASDYSNNLKLYIKNFTNENILELRKKVLDNVNKGNRASSLVDIIQRNYSVSKSKAKFLARQETSLAMASFRKERYKDLGVVKYRWSTSQDQRVRDRHQALHGKIFFYDNPPIVDDKGNRANPSQDFGCRCVDIPILEAI